MRLGAWLGAIVTVLLAATAPAPAHDSLAPPGAPHEWLPTDDWVYRHWVPFDDALLRERLDLRGRRFERYLFDDHRTFAQRARRRGVDVDALAAELTPDPLLRERTLRLMTQGHLAQHLFFHPFHGLDTRTAAPAIFGLEPDRYYALRRRRWTPLALGRLGGRTRADVRAGMDALFVADFVEGLRLEVADLAASWRLLTRRRAQLRCWLRRPLPIWDPTHPYGDAFKWHGPHDAGYPATAAERRADRREMRRRLRELRPGCWAHVHH